MPPLDEQLQRRMRDFIEQSPEVNTRNRLAYLLEGWPRYYDYLEVLLTRCASSQHEFTHLWEQRMQRLEEKPGNRELSNEEWAEKRRIARLQELASLDIEAFYIFSKILLDRAADCFGGRWGAGSFPPSRGDGPAPHSELNSLDLSCTHATKSAGFEHDLPERQRYLSAGKGEDILH